MMMKLRITKSCRPLRGLDACSHHIPGVPLRSTPGSILPPAPQAENVKIRFAPKLRVMTRLCGLWKITCKPRSETLGFMSHIKSKPAFALRSSSGFAVCLIFVFWLLSFASAQDAQNESPENELKHGKYQSAILSFTKALQANPKDGKAQMGLLQAHLETGQYAEVEAGAKKFLALGGNEAQSRLMLGEVYSTTGRYAEAIGEFEKASDLAKKADQNPSPQNRPTQNRATQNPASQNPASK